MTRATGGALSLLVALVLVACGGDGEDSPQARTTATGSGSGAATTVVAGAAARKVPNRFDGGRALRLVRLQVGYGPRPAGSEALLRLAERLKGLLPRGRFEPLPGHDGLRNVVGRIPGTRPAIVLGAHYDTEKTIEGHVGANDGAAGTAAVVEAARALRKLKRRRGAPEIRFVLFDGEEEPRETDDFYNDALRGSRAYVAAHGNEVKAMLLLDYVGNKDLLLPREGTSDPGIWSQVRAAAKRAGKQRFFPAADGASIIDDHTPFLRAGIPAVDFIDWTYRYKDTTDDTPDKLSASSLDGVGETVVEFLRVAR